MELSRRRCGSDVNGKRRHEESAGLRQHNPTSETTQTHIRALLGDDGHRRSADVSGAHATDLELELIVSHDVCRLFFDQSNQIIRIMLRWKDEMKFAASHSRILWCTVASFVERRECRLRLSPRPQPAIGVAS